MKKNAHNKQWQQSEGHSNHVEEGEAHESPRRGEHMVVRRHHVRGECNNRDLFETIDTLKVGKKNRLFGFAPLHPLRRNVGVRGVEKSGSRVEPDLNTKCVGIVDIGS